jgi:hypothetical protein
MPKFALQFSDRFETPDLDLEHVVGCKSDVMECIMHTSDLHAWSHQQALHASSSLIETARRALKVEQKLERAQRKINTEENSGCYHQQQPLQHGSTDSRQADVNTITRIFACAASIYLHVVVSGAHPRVPEIKRGVTNTIEALGAMSNVELVRSLTWPICVSACMADGDQQRSFFERLEEGIIKEFGSSQRVLRAFRVARECWRLRDTRSGHGSNGMKGKAYDWKDSMASLGAKLLLL